MFCLHRSERSFSRWMLGNTVEKSQKANVTYIARPLWNMLYCIIESRQHIASWIYRPGRVWNWYPVSVLWVFVNLVSREMRIPSKCCKHSLRISCCHRMPNNWCRSFSNLGPSALIMRFVMPSSPGDLSKLSFNGWLLCWVLAVLCPGGKADWFGGSDAPFCEAFAFHWLLLDERQSHHKENLCVWKGGAKGYTWTNAKPQCQEWEGPISSLSDQKMLWCVSARGVGGEPKIVAKRDPSVSNSAWESIFQINVDFHFTTWKLGFLNISEYLARYFIQMDPSVTERRQQSGKSLYCACGGSYPRLSGGGSELIKKVPMVEKLPRRFNIIKHR